MHRSGWRWAVRTGAWLTLVLAGGAACSDSSKEETSSPPTKPSLPAGVEVTRPIKLTEAARVPENDPSLDYVDVQSDRLIFHYKASPKIALAVGNVVAGVQGKGYMRRLKSVTFTDPATLEAVTESAYMTEFILDGAFRVRSAPAPEDWVEGVASTKQPLDTKLQAFTPTTKNGFSCGDSLDNSLKITPLFDMDFDFELEIDIVAQIFPPEGRLEHALFLVDGGIEAGVDVSNSTALGLNCSLDLVKQLRKRLGNEKALTWELTPIKFAIGPVPIIITHSIEATASLQAGAQISFPGVKLHATTGYKLTMGAEHKNGAWQGIWKPQRLGGHQVTVPDEKGTVALNAAFTVGFFYKTLLWDLAGPKLGLEGGIEGKIESTPGTCTWNSTLEAGANLVLGAEFQIPLADWTLADYSQSFNLSKITLAEGTGKYGTCSDAGPDGGPDASPDGGTDAGVDAASDGAGGSGGSDGGACADAPAPNGSPCTCASGCASGYCVDGVCCNSKCDALCYSCSAAKKNSGPDGSCGETKVYTDPESECPSTTFCFAGQCKSPLGYPCLTDKECWPLGAGCRDGVCCNNSFCAEGNQSCTACTQAKTGQPDGTCATVFAGTDPFNSCELPGALVCVGPTKPGTCM